MVSVFWPCDVFGEYANECPVGEPEKGKDFSALVGFEELRQEQIKVS